VQRKYSGIATQFGELLQLAVVYRRFPVVFFSLYTVNPPGRSGKLLNSIFSHLPSLVLLSCAEISERLCAQIAHWRRRAVETRLLARGMKDREARALLLKLAASHDKLAELATARIQLWTDHLSSRSMT
jgi:hypothetical protein